MIEKKLTEEMIRERTKTEDIGSIRRVNLWGMEVTNVDAIAKMSSLRVLSMTFNRISSLEPFSHLKQLEELYLHKNLVEDPEEIYHLSGLPKLRVLSLSDNPCIKTINYRIKVIKALPQLYMLDNKNITPEEKKMATASSSLPVGPPLHGLKQGKKNVIRNNAENILKANNNKKMSVDKDNNYKDINEVIQKVSINRKEPKNGEKNYSKKDSKNVIETENRYDICNKNPEEVPKNLVDSPPRARKGTGASKKNKWNSMKRRGSRSKQNKWQKKKMARMSNQLKEVIDSKEEELDKLKRELEVFTEVVVEPKQERRERKERAEPRPQKGLQNELDGGRDEGQDLSRFSNKLQAIMELVHELGVNDLKHIHKKLRRK